MVPVPKTLREGTDCYRLFMALRDGQPHTHHELYRLHMIVHSRKSDLVHRHGCDIDVWSEGGTSYYQLRGLENEPAESHAGLAGSSSGTVRAEGYSERADGGPLLGSLPLAVRKEAGHAGSVVASSPEEPQTQPIRQPTLWEAA